MRRAYGHPFNSFPRAMGAPRRSFCLSKHHHPSKSEAEYCNWLFARLQHKEIKAYSLYPSVPLYMNRKLWKNWKIDFLVTELDGSSSWHESKGWNRSDQMFKLKRDAFALQYPKARLYINKILWTGKTTRKQTKWRMSSLKRRIHTKNVR